MGDVVGGEPAAVGIVKVSIATSQGTSLKSLLSSHFSRSSGISFSVCPTGHTSHDDDGWETLHKHLVEQPLLPKQYNYN